MVHTQPKDWMSVLLVLHPVSAPCISVLEVICALGQSRDKFALQSELFFVLSRRALVNHFYLIFGG